MTVSTFIYPGGGLVSTAGAGGPGLLPRTSFSQPNRHATSHVMFVQTPHLHSSMNKLAILVQLYDEHGDSHVLQASLSVSAALPGAADLSLTTYSMRGPPGDRCTRRYLITVPTTWFETASASGSTAIVTSQLEGYDSQSAILTVYGNPLAFSSRMTSAGIAGYFTSDASGAIPAETMRAGDSFYLQLYAHTGGLGLTSFEISFMEDTSVCQLVPTAGAFSPTYTGALSGDLSGAYQTELLTRLQTPDGKHSLPPLLPATFHL